MKASILIVSYLSRDIWHRWFENPGSFLSRLLVATLLGALLFGVHLTFRYSEFLLREQIGNLGLHNVTVSNYVAPAASSGKTASVAPLLENLSGFGRTLHFKRLPGIAQTEIAGDATVVISGRETFVALAPWLDQAGPADAYLFAPGLPVGLSLRAIYERSERDVRVVAPPRALSQLFGERPILLLPEFAPPVLEKSGYLETFLLMGTAERIEDLPALVESIDLTLKKDGYERAQVTSAAAWLEDLDRLQAQQNLWGAWFGVFCGGLVALVYGSITILEYQQNAFLSALIRSFGISGGFVLLRYLAESILLVGVAAACAALAIWLAVPAIMPWLEISGEAAAQLRAELLALDGLWKSLRWLGGGAVVAVLPVLLALRRPVGRVLG